MEDKYYFDKLYKKTKGFLWKGSVHKNHLDILIKISLITKEEDCYKINIEAIL